MWYVTLWASGQRYRDIKSCGSNCSPDKALWGPSSSSPDGSSSVLAVDSARSVFAFFKDFFFEDDARGASSSSSDSDEELDRLPPSAILTFLGFEPGFFFVSFLKLFFLSSFFFSF